MSQDSNTLPTKCTMICSRFIWGHEKLKRELSVRVRELKGLRVGELDIWRVEVLESRESWRVGELDSWRVG
jgi:hypothetical protein